MSIVKTARALPGDRHPSRAPGEGRPRRRAIAGLIAGLVGLAGCGGGGQPIPETGGAGIPGVRGPAAPTKGKGAARPGAGAAAGDAAKGAPPKSGI